MAALAYLVPPVTGLWAFLRGPDARTRAHGFQAIALGAAWPVGLYIGSWITPGVTQVIAGAFFVVWLTLITSAAFGRGFIVGSLVERLEPGAATDEL